MLRDCIKLAVALTACVGYYLQFLRERQALERELAALQPKD
jgi:hypothetical protein